MLKKNKYLPIVFTGLVVGVISVVLVMLGNPKNMGFCIACFIRDIAGACGLHSAGVVQYVR
ncbi:MAG: YedE-related selenium metabolism membrane protein, partial [Oscillospiraceae bacterium]